MDKAKPYCISREEVYAAYEAVKANKGAAGVDGQSIADFEENLTGNLYKIWNRLCSGSYFPPAVLKVSIPKADGKERQLGIPTVGDRVAQMVVKNRLEPLLDPRFHVDSYGYRPGKSALAAVTTARQRCWRYDWVIDLDIEGFFDTIRHDLLMRLVRRHAPEAWMVLYIERWLKAPAQDDEGSIVERLMGTPQGGVISPLLANLFLHYAFDRWMSETYPDLPFERYADDALVHCRTEAQAQATLDAIRDRMKRCGLTLHPVKTRIVYCQDGKRRRKCDHTSFDFLGFTFRARRSRSRDSRIFSNFSPAVSDKASIRIRAVLRDWGFARRSDLSLEAIAEAMNSRLRGWMSYYGSFYISKLSDVLSYFDFLLGLWASRKYKKLYRRPCAARQWVVRLRRRARHLFAHWQPVVQRGSSSVGAV
jgi:RNA-directed DNA polymerase